MFLHLGLRHKLFIGLTGLGLLVGVGVVSCLFYVSQESHFWEARAENRERYARSLQLEVTFERFNSALLNATFASESVPIPMELIRDMDDGIGRMGQLRLPPDAQILQHAQREWEALRNSADDVPAGTAEERRLFFEKYIHPGVERLRAELTLLTRYTHEFEAMDREKLNARETRVEIFIATVLVVDALLIALVSAFVITPAIRPLRRATDMIRQLQAGELSSLASRKTGEDMDELVSTVQQFAAQLQDQRKTDEARMKRMEISVETAINGLADGVAVLNPTGHIEVANQVAQRLFGIKPGESVESLSLPWLTALIEQARGSNVSIIAHEGILQIFDERMERFFSPKLSVLRHEDEIQGFTLVLADTTMVRQIEEAKSSLIATVSHELKTPLTSIQMAVHLLLDGVLGSLNSKQTELMIAARDDTTKLHQMIERLLDTGRLHAYTELQFQEYPPHELAQQAIEATSNHSVIENRISKDLPPVLADSHQIGQAVSAVVQAVTLLKNRENGGNAEIQASSHQQYVDFSITLKGELESEHYDTFFEKMMVVKGIVATHGGVFELQQESGAPIAIRFTLRRADAMSREKSEPDRI